MPIPADEWKLLIEGALWRLSDQNYQMRAWFDKHEEQTDPGEQICQILDDYNFEGFISSEKAELSERQQQIAMDLVRRLKSFGGNSHAPLNPYNVINDIHWKTIQTESGRLLRDLFPESIRPQI